MDVQNTYRGSDAYVGQLITEPQQAVNKAFLTLIASITCQYYKQTEIYYKKMKDDGEFYLRKKVLIPQRKEEILFNDLFKSLEKGFYGIGIDSDSGSSGCFFAWVKRGEIPESADSAGWYIVRKNPSEPESNEFIFVATATATATATAASHGVLSTG
ncbi:hypothetical protein [Piscirickettsia salmonis]|uniref:hypothetical protein n=1 Tax=Piscirickettsia salmonis TaxID=1238 RepID=UPI0012B705C5|nr:hypothetical protein [Piscirickettsia salmonis]QHS31964.1 hypothetical protein GW535_04940 [Piscirickettsia salmonis]